MHLPVAVQGAAVVEENSSDWPTGGSDEDWTTQGTVNALHACIV
jgi:hypothetical protein